jgi:ATP-dependent RNA helicase DeaD
MTTKLFSELGISADLLKGIDRLGFEKAAPIQAEAIPVLLAGRDVVGQSQTGSGKTAAFALPALEKIDVHQRAVQVLILCPTRELAVQVSEEIHKLAFFKSGIRALPIYGGQSYDRQIYGLKQGAQIVIGTPGRVMDHMRRGTLKLDQVKMAILDEADVMLDMGFRDDIEFILQAVPKERQTVFFSATMPRPIQELIKKYARDPQQVRIEQKAMTVPTVEQTYYEVDRRFKIELLTRLIDIHDLKLGIIFCNTKRMVDDLVDHLNAQGYSADRLHGDMTQGLRDRVMNKFRKSGLEFLVATDVAARGIDVSDVQVVFNYDLPYDVEDYVHRIGRTGRAGRSGRAISFVAGREVFQIRNIERYTNTRIHRAKIPSPAEVEEARASAFLDKLRATLESGEYKRHDHLIEVLLEEGFSSTDIASALIHQLQSSDGSRPGTAVVASGPTHVRDEMPDRNAGRGQRWDRREPRPDFNRDERESDTGGARPLPHRGPSKRDQRSERKDHRPAETASTSRDASRSHPPRERQATPQTGTAAPAETARDRRFKEAQLAPPRAELPNRPARKREDHLETESEESPSSQSPAKSTPPRQVELPSPRSDRPNPEAAKILARRGPARPIESPESSKASRRTPPGQTRLHMSVGEQSGVTRADIIRAIQGQTGLPASAIGEIDLRERHSFVDVASEHANAIVSKLKRSELGNQRLKVKLAKSTEADES